MRNLNMEDSSQNVWIIELWIVEVIKIIDLNETSFENDNLK